MLLGWEEGPQGEKESEERGRGIRQGERKVEGRKNELGREEGRTN